MVAGSPRGIGIDDSARGVGSHDAPILERVSLQRTLPIPRGPGPHGSEQHCGLQQVSQAAPEPQHAKAHSLGVAEQGALHPLQMILAKSSGKLRRPRAHEDHSGKVTAELGRLLSAENSAKMTQPDPGSRMILAGFLENAVFVEQRKVGKAVHLQKLYAFPSTRSIFSIFEGKALQTLDKEVSR